MSVGKTIFYSLAAVLMLSPSLEAQVINTFAGSGSTGTWGSFSGDDGPATAATLNRPFNIAMDKKGNLYIADDYNFCIRKVDPSGMITTAAGTPGVWGFAGDGGPATAALFNYAVFLAVDTFRNLFVADVGNYRIRKIDTAGIITTIAGNGTTGFSPDGTPATAAALFYGSISGVCIATDRAGTVYFGDAQNFRIRKIGADGNLVTVAGNGTLGLCCDGMPATAAAIMQRGMVLDDYGNIFVAEDQVIQRIDAVTGIITTIAGNDTVFVDGGDGGPATAATIDYAEGQLAFDSRGNLYFGEGGRVREISATGIISTVAGDGYLGFAGDGGPATNAEITIVFGMAMGGGDMLYVSDYDNNRVRVVNMHYAAPTFAAGAVQTASLCSGMADSLNALLTVADTDATQTLTWSVVLPPAHGTLAAACTRTSTGTATTPYGIYYLPDAGYTGTDTLAVAVTNGVQHDTTTVCATVGSCDTSTATPMVSPMKPFAVYPNPAAGHFKIAFAGQDTATFTLFDVEGRLVAQKTLRPGTAPIMVDCSILPPGLYIYRLAMPGLAPQSGKLVVEN